VSWYLTIAPTAGQPPIADTRELLAFLGSLPKLRQSGPMTFEAEEGQPWVHIVLAQTNDNGGYACDGSLLSFVNVVELVCSYDGDQDWYDSLAVEIAKFLGWTAVEESAERRVWPP
jgi:hypothetical protein